MIRSPQLSLCQRNEKWIFILFNRTGEIKAYHTQYFMRFARARFLFINFEVSVLLDWMSFVCSLFFFFFLPIFFSSFFSLSLCLLARSMSVLSPILFVSTIYFILIQPYRAHKLHIISVSLSLSLVCMLIFFFATLPTLIFVRYVKHVFIAFHWTEEECTQKQ